MTAEGLENNENNEENEAVDDSVLKNDFKDINPLGCLILSGLGCLSVLVILGMIGLAIRFFLWVAFK